MTYICIPDDLAAVFTQVGYNFVTKRAPMNAAEVISAGDAPAERDAWLGAVEDRDEATAQEYVYSTLVLSIVDVLPEIVGRIDENSEECWTDLWNELLRKFQQNERPARARQIMHVTSRCTTFNGRNEDWMAHIAGVESDLAVLKSFSGEFTAEEVVCVLVLQGMMKAGCHWSILGSILIAEEPAEGKEGPTLSRIVDKALEHLMHFGDGWTGQVVGYGADAVDFKTAVNAAVA
eukprot:3447506-Rhodomonas_salina.1